MNLASEPQIDSIVDGIGLRTVIWFQGCKHNCYKCHNPQTHSFDLKLEMSVDEIVNFYLKQELQDGVTLSGGDPFYQDSNELLELLQKLKQHNVNIWCYTGFTYEYLLEHFNQHLHYIDVLVDGLYINDLRDLSLYFRGSSNQRIIDVNKSLLFNRIIELEEVNKSGTGKEDF